MVGVASCLYVLVQGQLWEQFMVIVAVLGWGRWRRSLALSRLLFVIVIEALSGEFGVALP